MLLIAEKPEGPAVKLLDFMAGLTVDQATVWSLIWRDQPLDFLTAARRQEVTDSLDGIPLVAQRARRQKPRGWLAGCF